PARRRVRGSPRRHPARGPARGARLARDRAAGARARSRRPCRGVAAVAAGERMSPLSGGRAGSPADGLAALLAPRAVAVIGASRERGTISGEVFHNLLAYDFHGRVIPVNPRAPEVQWVRAYPNVESVPEAVDLAVIVVPAAA